MQSDTGNPVSVSPPSSEPDPEKVGQLYDRIDMEVLHFGYWANPDDDFSFDIASPRLTDELLRRLHVEPGQRILDVGCGTGTPTVQLARTADVEVVGVTVSRDQVRRATEYAEREGVADRVTFLHADAMNLPMESDSFDAAFALESILHMDRVRALRSVGRVVRPGGRIAVTDFFQRGPKPTGQPSLMELMAQLWFMTPAIELDDYHAITAKAGLHLDELRDISLEVVPKSFGKFFEQVNAGDFSMFPEAITGKIESGGTEELVNFARGLATSQEFGYLLMAASNPA